MATDFQLTSHLALLEFFELDLNPIGVDLKYHFCNYNNTNGVDIIWRGVSYTAYPIQASGFEKSSSGTLPTPEIKVSNVLSGMSLLIISYQGLIGAKLTRSKLFYYNLDGYGGASGSPDPNATEEVQVWYISRYSENALFATFTLRHPLELKGIKIPRRRMAEVS